MLTQSIVAVLVGFAIGVPTAFWLLKKVRIKARVRHLQVSLGLGLPITLFVFLLQTRFAVPVFVIAATASLLFITLELTLRRLVAGATDQSAVSQMGKIGSGVDFNEARAAAGLFPDDYMIEAVWLEMQEFMKSRSAQKQDFKSHQNRKLIIKSFEMHKNINFVGTNYSMFDGIRSTTDAINSSDQMKLFLFGGSTVLCEEVPDRLTNASILQRMLNSLPESVQVFNYGASGATSIDRVQMLIQDTKIEKDDVVIFYFGDNDSGWIDYRSGKLAQQLVWLPVRAMRGLSDFGFEIAKWMYGEFAPRSFRKFSRLAVNDTIGALNEAHQYCLNKGAHMVAILQPNLYTLRTKSDYEKKLEQRFSQDIKTLIFDAYKQYEAWVKTVSYGVSATHIFNNAPSSVFLDWAHVNARGNELIAKFIFDELHKRDLVSGLQEV